MRAMHAGVKSFFVIIRRNSGERMKKARQKAIVDLIRGQEITSQEQLTGGAPLAKDRVSQSTLSRDIQELGLAKTGGVYTVFGSDPPRKFR
jgi:hypothetical protein